MLFHTRNHFYICNRIRCLIWTRGRNIQSVCIRLHFASLIHSYCLADMTNFAFLHFRRFSRVRILNFIILTMSLSHFRITVVHAARLNFGVAIRTVRNKKLNYRRGTARCAVSVEILPIATQQCRNYLYDKSWTKYQLSLIDPCDKIVLQTALDDLCDKLQWSSVGARKYYRLSWPTTAQFITFWASTFLELSW